MVRLADWFVLIPVLAAATPAAAEIPYNLILSADYEPATWTFKKSDLNAASDPDFKGSKSFSGAATGQAEFLPLGSARAFVGASLRFGVMQFSDTYKLANGVKVDAELSTKPFLVGFEGGVSFPIPGDLGLRAQMSGGYEFALNEAEADADLKPEGGNSTTVDGILKEFGRAAFRGRISMPLAETPGLRVGVSGGYLTGSGSIKSDDSSSKFDYSAFAFGGTMGWIF